MKVVEEFYNRSPLWFQNQMVSLYGVFWQWLRFGGGFKSSAGRSASGTIIPCLNGMSTNTRGCYSYSKSALKRSRFIESIGIHE